MTGISRIARRWAPRATFALALALCLGWFSGSALAAPAWVLNATSDTTVAPGGQVVFHVDLLDLGDVPSNGSAYTVRATLPPGMTGVAADGSANNFVCSNPVGASTISCSTSFTALTGIVEPLTFTAAVDPSVPVDTILTARFSAAGGGAPGTGSTARPVTVTDVPPAFGIDAFDAQVTADAAGTPYTQAGGHPYGAFTAFDINTQTDPNPAIGDPQPVEPLKDATVDLPPGFVGNPTGVAQCSNGDLSHTVGPSPEPFCATTSQVGTATVLINGQGLGTTLGPLPVFNMEPPPGVPARFGVNVAGSVIVFDAHVRTGGDYGLSVTSHNIPEGVTVIASRFNFWGVPSDPSHDLERACPGQIGPGFGGPFCTSGAPRKAFLRNPTSCTPPGQGLPTTLHIDSWFNPTNVQVRTITSHLTPGYPLAPQDWGAPQGTTGCENVPFDPVLRAKPLAGSTAAAPAAFAFDLSIPQSDNPDVPAEADLRTAVVTLPAGVHVSPSSADGLGACSSDQIALSSDAEPTCPDASKIGTVTIDTPLLDVPVTGNIYLAKPFDNPFDSLLAVYIVASAKGVVIKLPGAVRADPGTGQIVTTFDNNPQLPFSNLHVEFKSGPRAPLALPDQCGTYTTQYDLTGWNGRTVHGESSFDMPVNAKGQPCPPKFTPGFTAGTASNAAGSSSSFLLRFTRDDDDQQLSALTVHMPGGLTGKIANAVLCSDADATAGTCPDGTKIGDVTVGAGAGSDPFFITNGRAYLTGPYKGAPFGVSIVVPAVAGPFDLGNVVVRSALFVDKHDASVSIVSDPLPTILQGIPLDVRDVRVNVDKPDFFLNPTSCAQKTIAGTLSSTGGLSANVSDRFQAADCAGLGFVPHMALSLGGAHHIGGGQTTPLTTRLTMPAGDANLRFVRVTLPKTLNARLTVINNACTRAEFESDVSKCAHAQAGTAVAATPLLRDPLRGNVYFVKNGHPLPDLFVALRGQVAFDLIGQITIVNNTRLRTTFPSAPDVPIRSFTLRLFGDSKHGSIGVVSNLCAKSSRAEKVELDYIGQNGKVLQVDQAPTVHGCPKPKHKTKPRHGRKG